MLFGVFHGPEPGDHHDAKGHEPAVMVWPLVPLAIGALLLGYLEWPSAMLSHRLASTVAHSEPVSALSTPGMIAFGLGVMGFVIAGVMRQRGGPSPTSSASEPVGVRWVEPIAAAAESLSRALGTVHSGHLGRYLLASIVGIVVIVWIGLKG
jgi:NADH:ubiquinone oxidoreductase subunit 5 (subunit L)/multisubunit Na+/H+ antiporter MnhA subunit